MQTSFEFSFEKPRFDLALVFQKLHYNSLASSPLFWGMSRLPSEFESWGDCL